MAQDQQTAARRRYPVGIQTFEDVRRGGYVYVDKTRFVHELAHGSGKAFFLSRPRRFGKSLLLSTIQAYFEGRRELFEGLEIAALAAGDWETFPVIRLDLSTLKANDMEQLLQQLDFVLAQLEETWGSNPAAKTPGTRLAALISAAHKKTGKQVVVLVDEYDAPLLGVMHEPDKIREMRDAMREFYAPLKAYDQYLRFVMLTGITKMSQLSIFSELNNLSNISMLPQFASICGITQDELATQMKSDVELFAQALGTSVDEAFARLKANYDGYHFCAQSPDIYNPFSLLSALQWGQLDSYWFASGTPTALVNLLRKNNWEIDDLEGREASAAEFDAPTEGAPTPLPLLYQAGYLTIKGFDDFTRAYTLGIPNAEVAQGLSKALVQYAAGPDTSGFNGFLRDFARALRDEDVEAALVCMRSFLAGIPYHLGSRSERGFQTTFWLVFTLLGAQVETEVKTATGRIDAVLSFPGSVYVMEFKYNRSAAEAVQQIDDKAYLLPYEASGRKLYKVGVNFSEQAQTIDEWIVQEG